MTIRQPALATRVMWYASVGVAIAVISAGAIAGHLFNIEPLANFGGSVAMALNTAICFLLTGAAWITHAFDLRADADTSTPTAPPTHA